MAGEITDQGTADAAALAAQQADQAAQVAATTAATTQASPIDQQQAADAAAAQEAARAEESAKWVSHNDEFVDGLAAAFVQNGGKVADLEALMHDVGEAGTLTTHARKVLNDTFGAAAAAMIPAIEQKAAEHKKWITGERTAIYNNFGGEAGFNKVREWANTNLDPAIRQFLTNGLNAGGEAAQLASKQLIEIMRQKGATVTGDVIKAEGSGQAATERLTLTKYMAEYDKLHKSGDSEAIKALDARARVDRTKPGWRQ